MSTTTEEAVGKKGRTKLIIIIVAAAAVVLIAVAFALFTMLRPSQPEVDPAKEPGAVVTMEDAMTLNLADGKFLKTNLALQLSEAATAEAGGEAAIVKGAFDVSKARDAAISTLGRYKYSQLLDPKTKDAAQQALSAEVSKRYDGQVLRVYFTEFVMQ